MFKHGFVSCHRTQPFGARQLVNLRRDQSAVGDDVVQPAPGLEVVREPGMTRVEQEQGSAGRCGWPYLSRLPISPEVFPDHRLELAAITARVAVSGQIDQIERRPGAARD